MSPDDLLPEYERELALLRRSLAEFAERYPRAATRLAISGEHSEDPQVERLIQSAALLNARASARINDDFPEFTTALLEIRYPEFLRPFPSCSIARFGGTPAIETLTEPAVIKRGAELKTQVGGYVFRTAYDVIFAPLRIADARYAQTFSVPPRIRLGQDTTGILSVTFASLAEGMLSRSNMARRVRVFVDGDRHTVAAAMDAMLLRASGAFVEADGSGQWIALDPVPVASVGLSNDEALIERRDSQRSPFRLLLEYFSFPQKFDFIDIDLSEPLRTAGPCCRLTLHLPISGMNRDSVRARHLAALSSDNLKLFCSPIINLFARAAEPISLADMAMPVYPLVPNLLNAPGASIYRVDEVRLSTQARKGADVRTIPPYRSLMHHAASPHSPVFWLAERDGRLAELLPGQDMRFSLVDSTGVPVALSGQQIDADLMCTNGRLPASLRVGDPEGDLIYADTALAGHISMLSQPTDCAPRPMKDGQIWELLSMMSANPVHLCEPGLSAFKGLFNLHVSSHASSAARHIEGLAHLSFEMALEWVQSDPQPGLARCTRVRLAIDDAQLVDCPISVLVHVLESIFVRYVRPTGFVQLVVTSAHDGTELARGEPLAGEMPPI